MIYRQFRNLKLSALGMGTMRLPTKADNSEIDMEAAEAMVDYAMAHGVNYYDTAWGYHDGNSEIFVGKALSRYPRDSFFLATKFPGYDLSNMGKVEEIFEKQLQKCRTDYFDFYLFHNVCEMNIDEYLDRNFNTFDYLIKQKKNGRIRHLGFSAHGSLEVMKRFLDYYGEAMEFCQIQLNYLDWSFQDAKAKAELLNLHNIPIFVMEPLRGGRLANLTEEEAEPLKKLRPDESIPAWAFRFIQSVPGVVVTLSGMSDAEQLSENVRIFETEAPLNKEETDVLLKTAYEMVAKAGVPCTACRYCVPHCPQGLDIPGLLKLYNEHSFTGGGFLAPMALMAIPTEKHPDACLGCRSCEKVCPQQIKISEALADFSKKLGK